MRSADPSFDLEIRVRPADDDDFDLIEASIRTWSDRQVLLPLDDGLLRTSLPDFRILSPAFGPRIVLAFGALRRYSKRLGEIRSLVVADEWRGRGLGSRLVGELIDEARLEGLHRVFVLAKTPGLFAALGFTLVPRESLPQKVFVDCSLCPRRETCDELALVKEIA